MSEVRKSLAYSTAESYLSTAMQIVSTVIIARILSPSDLGVFAIAAVFVGLAHMFRDFGIGEYLIQERNLNNDHIRAAFTAGIIVSWLMSALLVIGAPFAAVFFRTPGIGDVMRVQALTFLLIPFGAVAMAWFRREMNFRPQFIAGLLASSTSLVVTVVLALNGFGYMSLAWSSFAATVVTVTTSICMRPPGFPRWPGFKGLGHVFHFGRIASGIYIFGQLGKGAPEMIIGRAQDMASVGLFSRAQGLTEILNRFVVKAVMPIYLPYFANAVRLRGSPLPELLTSISYITAIGWPFLAFMGVATDSVIYIMYGEQWTRAVPLAKVVCVVAALELIYIPAKEVLLSVGKVREANRLQYVTQGVRILGALAGIPFGAMGVCIGLLVATVALTMLTYYWLHIWLDLGLRETLAALLPSLWVTLAAAGPVAVYVFWVPAGAARHVLTGVAGAIVAATVWLVAARALSHPLWPEVQRLCAAATRRFRR
jgi:O-antigen/teichoic acid export membrane protein